MLGKLLKHEFRATGRVMLPVLGVLVILALLFNLSVRFIGRTESVLVNVLSGLSIFAFVAGIIAAEIICLVLMINRFYKNLLGAEGYLTHTLPVNVHELVWSKMIVAFVWFFATNLLIVLIGLASAFIQGGQEFLQFLAEIPGWDEIRAMLKEVGLAPRHLVGLGLEWLLVILVGSVASCLHFYAAMAVGHAAAEHKGLFSVLAFIGISIFFSILSSMIGANSLDGVETLFAQADTALGAVRLASAVMLGVFGWELLQSALLYLATVLGLKRWLNLA